MRIKWSNNEIHIPNWLMFIGVLVVDNAISNGMRVKALKVLEKEKDSQ